MGKHYWITMVCVALLATQSFTAGAMHLGPLVPGVERTEETVFCSRNVSLGNFVEKDKQWAQKDPRGARLHEYLRDFARFYNENGCDVGEITYTPEQVLADWSARKMAQNRVLPAYFSLARSTQVNADKTKRTIWVIAEVPPPLPAPSPR